MEIKKTAEAPSFERLKKDLSAIKQEVGEKLVIRDKVSLSPKVKAGGYASKPSGSKPSGYAHPKPPHHQPSGYAHPKPPHQPSHQPSGYAHPQPPHHHPKPPHQPSGYTK